MSGTLALGVLIRVLTAVPDRPGGRVRRWRGRRALRGFVWEVDGTDACADTLERAEGVLVTSRIVGLLSRAEYRDQMQRVARIDQERRPVRVPQTGGT